MTRLNPERVIKTIKLTNRLEKDILDRQLRPGDCYYTVREASDFLGVTELYANQALQLLEKRQIIRRRQRLGSCVLVPVGEEASQFSHVHLLVSELYYREEGYASEPMALGLREQFSDVMIGYCFLAMNNEMDGALQSVKDVMSHGNVDGFVLMSTSYAVQKIIADSGLPAVIHGSPYATIESIPYLERDHRESFLQIIQWLRQRKRHHWAFLMREEMHPGDQVILNLFRECNEFSLNFPILFTGMDAEEITNQAGLLFLHESFPDAIICTSLIQARAVEEYLYAHHLRPYRDVDLVVLIYHYPDHENSPYTHIELDIPLRNIGRKIAGMLQCQLHGVPVTPELLPVKLCHSYRETE